MTKIGEMAEEAKKAAKLAQEMMIQAAPIIESVKAIADRLRAEFAEDQLQVRFDICGIKDVLVLHFDMTDVAGNLKDITWNTANTAELIMLLEEFVSSQKD